MNPNIASSCTITSEKLDLRTFTTDLINSFRVFIVYKHKILRFQTPSSSNKFKITSSNSCSSANFHLQLRQNKMFLFGNAHNSVTSQKCFSASWINSPGEVLWEAQGSRRWENLSTLLLTYQSSLTRVGLICFTYVWLWYLQSELLFPRCFVAFLGIFWQELPRFNQPSLRKLWWNCVCGLTVPLFHLPGVACVYKYK